MDTLTHATEEAVHGGYRPRPYVGRYVAPAPLPRRPKQSVSARIAILIQSASFARYNAHSARRGGDEVSARAAFFRAHYYLEMVRELRTQL